MNGLGIVAALAAESRPLGPSTPHGEGLAILADGTLSIVSGIGPAAARNGARRLVESGARALVSFGLAGALDPALAAGTLVLPAEVISPEGRLQHPSPAWRARVVAALGGSCPVCAGKLLTSAKPILSATDKAAAFRQTGAAAVDMESAAVAEVAEGQRLPFLAVRAIVDTASDTLPEALMAVVSGPGGVRLGSLAASLARAPGDIPALLVLARRYRAARRALATVARSGALAPRELDRPPDRGE